MEAAPGIILPIVCRNFSTQNAWVRRARIDTMFNRTKKQHRKYRLLALITLTTALFGLTVPADPANATVGSQPATVSLGGSHACKILDGTVQCWGQNDRGQLGDGTQKSRSTPATVVGLAAPATSAITLVDASCALLTTGQIQCWGSNAGKQLGAATALGISTTPVTVAGMKGPAVAISGTWEHGCAILANDQVQCWGSAIAAPAGTFDQDRVIRGIEGKPTAIASSYHHTCIVVESGTIQCLGYDGAYNDENGGEGLVVVEGLTGKAVDVALNYGSMCVLFDNGSTHCRGFTYGHDGNRSTRLDNPFTGPASAIAKGGCAVLVSGELQCLMRTADLTYADSRYGYQVAKVVDTTLTVVRVTNMPGPLVAADTGGGICGVLLDGTIHCLAADLYVEPPAPSDVDCSTDTLFIGARGSGQAPQQVRDQDQIPHDDDVPAIFRGTWAKSRYITYFWDPHEATTGMGPEIETIARVAEDHSSTSITFLGLNYRATPVDVLNPSYDDTYRASVDDGADRLVEALTYIDEHCAPSTPPKVILGGYSQGAHVIQDALARIEEEDLPAGDLITKVILVGSPLHTAGRGDRPIGEATTQGTLIALRKQATDGFAVSHGGVVDSLCAWGDLVCDEGNARSIGNAENAFAIHNSTAAQIHTHYPESASICGITSKRQPNLVCGANSVLQALGDPLIDIETGQSEFSNPDSGYLYNGKQGGEITVGWFFGQNIGNPIQKILNWKMYSTPTELGTSLVNEDGISLAELTLPEDLPIGQHRLVAMDEQGNHYSHYIYIHPRSSTIDPPTIMFNGQNTDTTPLPEPSTPNPEPPSGDVPTGRGL